MAAADLDVTLASIGGHETTSDLIRLTDAVILLAWLLPVLGLLLLAVVGALRRSGWRGVVQAVGSGALAAAGALIVLLVVGSFLAARLDEHTLGGALGAATWRELDRSFWLAAGIVAAAGFLLRVVASPGLDLEPSSLAARGWQSFTPQCWRRPGEGGRGGRADVRRERRAERAAHPRLPQSDAVRARASLSLPRAVRARVHRVGAVDGAGQGLARPAPAGGLHVQRPGPGVPGGHRGPRRAGGPQAVRPHSEARRAVADA
ncbi:MAG: hypothetical protein JWR27_2659 [Aeromicrobium sp.]|nr:hypothetical protein [Aeromicrobium sp.]